LQCADPFGVHQVGRHQGEIRNPHLDAALQVHLVQGQLIQRWHPAPAQHHGHMPQGKKPRPAQGPPDLGVAFPAQAGKRVPEDDLAGVAIRYPRGQRHHQVDIALLQLLAQITTDGADLETQPRGLFGRATKQRRQQEALHIVGTHDGDFPLDARGLDFRAPARQGPHLQKQIPHRLDQRMGKGREREPAPVWHQQRITKIGAELGQGGAHRRLAQVHQGGGLAHAGGGQHRIQQHELIEVQLVDSQRASVGCSRDVATRSIHAMDGWYPQESF
jgi:hypothetical protein